MRIKELDGLRGIAILAVVACHYLSWLPATGAQHGWLGVDLFFILSGFLITTILVNLRGSEHYFSVFYARRALRIFPIYYLAVLIYLVVSLASGKAGSLHLWMQYIFYYTSLGVGEPRELSTSVPKVVCFGMAVLWSLSVEEIYYTIWAPLVRFTSHRVFTGILAGMVIVAPLLRWMLHTPSFPELFTFYCRMDGLAMGSMVALGVLALNRSEKNGAAWDKAMGWAGAFIGLITLLLWVGLHGERKSLLLSTIGVSLMDVSFALFAFAVIRRTGSWAWWVRPLRAKWLRSIGMISYSLYVFHYPIYGFVSEHIGILGLSRRPSAVAQVVVAFALSLLVSYSLWYLFESRILRWKDRHVPSGGHVASASEAAVEVAGA